MNALLASGSPAATVSAAASGPVTATMLADIVRCEMRAQLDVHGDRQRRGQVSGFVETLWRQGSRFEDEILAGLEGNVVDLRDLEMGDRMAATVEAMRGGGDWILGARLVRGDIEGRPDLLQRHEGMWTAGDVKSGGALAQNGRDPRIEFGVQVGLYAHLLATLGLGRGDVAFVIGADRLTTWYDVDAPFGRDGRSLSVTVAELVSKARAIRDGIHPARPALCSACGMCVWRGVCRERLSAAGDLTLIPGLGRAVRAAIEGVAVTVADLAVLDVDALRGEGGRTALPGVGAARLGTFRERARMLVSDAPPFATRPLGLARREVEFHLDLETDPTDHDLCYFHGVVSRRRVDGVDTEEYVHFLAADRSEERDAFAAAVSFLTAEPEALVTTFSAFEATTYRRLAARYPEVASAEVIDRLFAKERCVDLYFGAVLPATNWPLNSLGLKSLGKFLGFDWNDPDASGASSISWFVDWRETRDPALLERILRYNQADCVASRVVFDALLQLPVMDAVPWPPASERRP